MCFSSPSAGPSAQQQAEQTNQEIALQQQTAQEQMQQQQQIADQQNQLAQQQFAYQQQQDTAAQQQAQQQRDLQNQWATGQTKAIQTGQQAVNDAFANFTPSYFQDYANTLLATGKQQIQQQAGTAQRNVALNLARGGNLDSSAQGYDIGQLEQTKGQAIADYANQTQDAAAQLQQQYANTKQGLMQQVSSAATVGEPSAPGTLQQVTQGIDTANRSEATIGQNAQNIVPTLTPVTPPSVVGNVFGGVAGSVGQALSGQQAGSALGAYRYGLGQALGPTGGAPGGGGLSVV